jgi:hypothetical protein
MATTAKKTTKTTAKKAKKTPAKRRKKAARRSKQRALPTLRLVPRVPERLEDMEMVKQLVTALERREGDLNEAIERLEGAYHDVTERLGSLEERTRDGAERRLEDLLGRVRDTRAGEAIEELPDRARDEVDDLLDRLGLMRKTRHEELLGKAKKRAKAAGRRQAKKELEQSTANA